jgi:3-dehydroquinate synthetase
MPAGGPTQSDRSVRVQVPGHEYEVRIGTGLLSRIGETLGASSSVRPGSRVFLAHDANLPQAVASAAGRSLETSGFRVSAAALRADESDKTLSALQPILVELAKSRQERHEPLIALGGGLVGDLAGFAGAIYRRGIPVIQCPTTLLSMVDASVGGKTGANLAIEPGDSGLLKNVIGAFHQPILVLADVSTLISLPDRQYRSGIAECIKHGLLSADFGDPGLADWTAAQLDSIVARDATILAELIQRNIAVKAAVVRGDEREVSPTGGRALLNLGHTFGHAIETLTGLTLPGFPAGPLLHGEAVALGLIAATACSAASGSCPPSLLAQVQSQIAKTGLSTKVQGLPPDAQLLSRMGHDKKVEGGSLRLILPAGSGRSKVARDPSPAHIQSGWAAIRA